MQQHRSIPRRRTRRGSAYLAVLGTSLVATTLLTGAIFVQQAKIRADSDAANGAVARQAAESGIELTRAYIKKVPNWRTSASLNVSDIALGRATLSIGVSDPTDGDVLDRPYDPIVVTCTARAGRAEQLVGAHLTAHPVPMNSLANAIHANDKVVVNNQLILGAGWASANEQIDSDGIIEGNATSKKYKKDSNITGTEATTGTLRVIPDAGVVAEWYAAFGTRLFGVRNLDRRLLAPELNPFGLGDPEGVYIIREAGDITIKNCRILGTLIVICPGYKVTIENNVLLQSANADMPTLIVVGNLVSNFVTAGQTLSEAANGVNFNPVGASYNGVADSDLADSYPSEIDGLVHVSGSFLSSSTSTIRGSVLCGATATISGVQTIAHKPSLVERPPMGYAAAVELLVTPASLQRVVR